MFSDPRTNFLMGQEMQQLGMMSPYSSAPISDAELSFLNPQPTAGGSAVNSRDMFMGLAQILPLLDEPKPQMSGLPGGPSLGDSKLAPSLFGATLPGPGPRVPGLNSFLMGR